MFAAAFLHFVRPVQQRIGATRSAHRPGRLHKRPSQVAGTGLGNPGAALSIRARRLSWHETQVGGHPMTIWKSADIVECSYEADGSDLSNPRHGHQSPTHRVVL